MLCHMNTNQPRGKVLIAKAGLDGHDRGAKFIVRALREDGFEVVYTGIRRLPEEIAALAAREAVDVVGLSSLSGAHNRLFPAVVAALRAAGAGDIPVVGGGIIPPEDIDGLRRDGVVAVFTPGTPIENVLGTFRQLVAKRRKGAARVEA